MAIINNFFPRERLDYYTKPQGLDKEPKLPPKLAGPLHKIITTTNLHPVKVAWRLLFLLSRARLPQCLTCSHAMGLNCLRRSPVDEGSAGSSQVCLSHGRSGLTERQELVREIRRGGVTGQEGQC